jgi:hypothetical protein
MVSRIYKKTFDRMEWFEHKQARQYNCFGNKSKAGMIVAKLE